MKIHLFTVFLIWCISFVFFIKFFAKNKNKYISKGLKTNGNHRYYMKSATVRDQSDNYWCGWTRSRFESHWRNPVQGLESERNSMWLVVFLNFYYIVYVCVCVCGRLKLDEIELTRQVLFVWFLFFSFHIITTVVLRPCCKAKAKERKREISSHWWIP